MVNPFFAIANLLAPLVADNRHEREGYTLVFMITVGFILLCLAGAYLTGTWMSGEEIVQQQIETKRTGEAP